MAGLAMRVSDPVSSSLWGHKVNTIRTVFALQSADDADSIFVDKLFKDIDQYDTSVMGLGALGSLPSLTAIPEMGLPPVIDRTPYPDLELFAQDWANELVISDKMFRNREFAKIESQVLNLSPMYYTTIQQFAEELYVQAIRGTNGSMWNGKKINVNANDGLPQFDTAHKSPIDTSVPTQSNKFSNELTGAGVSAVRSAMSRFRDGNGNLLGIAGDTLLVCDDPVSQSSAYSILGTASDPDQIAKRYNYLRGAYNIVNLKYAGARLQQLGWTGPLPWVMLDSTFLSRAMAAVMVNFREPHIDVVRDVEREGTKFITRAEFNGRFNLWQYAAVGGCPSGVALDEPKSVAIDVNIASGSVVAP